MLKPYIAILLSLAFSVLFFQNCSNEPLPDSFVSGQASFSSQSDTDSAVILSLDKLRHDYFAHGSSSLASYGICRVQGYSSHEINWQLYKNGQFVNGGTVRCERNRYSVNLNLGSAPAVSDQIQVKLAIVGYRVDGSSDDRSDIQELQVAPEPEAAPPAEEPEPVLECIEQKVEMDVVYAPGHPNPVMGKENLVNGNFHDFYSSPTTLRSPIAPTHWWISLRARDGQEHSFSKVAFTSRPGLYGLPSKLRLNVGNYSGTHYPNAEYFEINLDTDPAREISLREFIQRPDQFRNHYVQFAEIEVYAKDPACK